VPHLPPPPPFPTPQLTLGEPFNCTSPQLLHWLLPASWSLSVVAADPAGNQAPPQATTWDVVFDDGAGRYTRFLRQGGAVSSCVVWFPHGICGCPGVGVMG
jgi:hypothetical protein